MIELPPTIRRVIQAAFCATAIGGGALVAHAMSAPEPPPAAAFPPPMPEPHLVATRPTPAEPSSPHLVAEALDALPPPTVAPFAESLAGGQVITGGTPHRLILFTFDDGPDPRNTPRLLDMLDAHRAKAVFFLTAHRMRHDTPWEQTNREIAQEIVRRGHVVANHTVDHPQLPLLPTEDVVAQVEGAEAVFTEVLGARTWLMRPPGGARSPRVDRLLADRGYTQVLWNLGTGDFQVREPEEVVRIFRRVLARRERENGERGGIVLLHDTHEWSVDAFPMIMAYLRERNCELIEQGEELYDVVDDPSYFHVTRGDDASAEAPPATLPADVLAERQRRIRQETRQRCERLASL